MKTLSEQEAYAAMFAFLEYHYSLTKSDDLGALLGSMALLPDKSPADPAIWEEWLEAIEKAASGNVNLNLNLAMD